MPDDAGFTISEADKPRLEIDRGDLPAVARKLAKLLATNPRLFERNGPVLLKSDDGGGVILYPMTVETVVNAAHEAARPFKVKRVQGKRPRWEEEDETLPDRVAKLYLDPWTDRGLRPLRGLSYAPILDDRGRLLLRDGYEDRTGLWCAAMPRLGRRVPARPTRDAAMAALMLLRHLFRTFPFADASRVPDAACGDVVDLTQPPGGDEGALLAALLTAVCRASLNLAPGLLITAPNISGAGTGKGLLVGVLTAIAFGQRPSPFTGGSNREEMEKRLGAALLEAAPAILIDNLNGVTLRSDLLASALTENPVKVRLLGRSEMPSVPSTAFLAVTGNGITLSEDLVRRFIIVELDARTEDPEARQFAGDLREDVAKRRAELLAAVLTIFRWGRQNADTIRKGVPLGGYMPWCAWVRDPLLDLGCADPVARISGTKGTDPRRQAIAELFQAWDHHHRSKPIKASDLHDEVRRLADPLGRGPQFVTSYLDRLTGTQIAGLRLERSKTAKWSPAIYALLRVLPPDDAPSPLQ
jgi:hypothetical protein